MQALQEIFNRQPQFDVLNAALTQARFPAYRGKEEIKQAWQNNPNLKPLVATVQKQLSHVGILEKVSIPGSSHPFEWLISGTSHHASNKLSKEGIEQICLLALEEAAPTVLEARRQFLATNEVTSLRRNLWLAINRELAFYPNTVVGEQQKFFFWDHIEDSLQVSEVGGGLYPEEVAIAVGKCFEEDTQDLKILGDFLTSCRALSSNRDAPQSKRTIEDPETKRLIKKLLEVTVLQFHHYRLTNDLTKSSMHVRPWTKKELPGSHQGKELPIGKTTHLLT